MDPIVLKDYYWFGGLIKLHRMSKNRLEYMFLLSVKNGTHFHSDNIIEHISEYV